jgi:cell division protein FtsB
MSTPAAAAPQAAARGKTPPEARAGAKPGQKGPVPATAGPRRRVRLTARGAVLLVLVMLLMVAAIGPARGLLAERSSLAELQQQSEELRSRNAELQAQIDRLNDPAYIEQLARECLGMVHAGEIAFRAIPKRGAPVPPRC